MKKLLILIISTLFSVSYTQAQPLSLNLDAETEELVDALQGAGVTILNAELDCNLNRIASYEDHNDILGIGDGVVLSAGNLVGLLWDNTEFPVPPFTATSGSVPRHIDSTFHRWLLDSWELDLLYARSSCALILDVVPEYATLSFDYVLGDGLLDSTVPELGEDWDESFNWISYSYFLDSLAECNCHPYTDFISALVMGGSLEDTINLAVFPEGQHGSTGVPVNRYTLRMDEEMFGYMCMYEGGAEGLYWDGGPYLDYCRFNQAGGSIEEPSLCLRGMTIPMTATIELEPCDTYKLVLGTGMVRLKPPCIGAGANVVRAAYFISNLHSSGADCTAGVEEADALPGLGIGPNPFKTELLLSYTAAQGDEHFRIVFSDITGRTLLQAQGTIENLNQDIAKIIPSLTPGTYIAQLTHTKNAKSKVFKVVKE